LAPLCPNGRSALCSPESSGDAPGHSLCTPRPSFAAVTAACASPDLRQLVLLHSPPSPPPQHDGCLRARGCSARCLQYQCHLIRFACSLRGTPASRRAARQTAPPLTGSCSGSGVAASFGNVCRARWVETRGTRPRLPRSRGLSTTDNLGCCRTAYFWAQASRPGLVCRAVA